MNSVLYVLCAALLLVLWQWVVHPLFISTLSKIPCAHPTAHISNFWIWSVRWRNVQNETLYQLHNKLGPIIRLAPNELSVNCYDGGIKTIYGGGFPKHDFYLRRFTNYETPPMFAMKEHKEHSTRKRMLSQVYAKSNVLSSSTLRETTKAVIFDRLMPILSESAMSGKPIEMHKLNYAYSMDSFMAFQVGLKQGSNFIQNEKEREWYLDAFFSRRPWFFWTDEFPGFTTWLAKIGLNLVPKWADEATDSLADWNLRICDGTEALLAEGKDIPTVDYPVVYAHERAQLRKWGGRGMAPTHLQRQPYPYRLDLASDAYDHNAAAIETSGDTLTWLFYELSRQPKLQERLRNELSTLKPPMVLTESGGPEELPDFKTFDPLPILDAVLQETLRIWTAVPGGQPRLTPHPSCSLAGYDNIPPGVKVMSSAYALHRDPLVFPDPEKWDPNRWLDASPEQLVEMRHRFWAWGSGGRMCIGNHFANHSMKSVIAAIYTNFKTTIVEAPDMEQAEGFTAGPKGNKLVLHFQHL